MAKLAVTSERAATETLSEAISKLTLDGEKVIFTNHTRFDVLSAALAELVKFPAAWHHTETYSRVHRSLVQARRTSNEIDLPTFLELLERACDDLWTAKAHSYDMWTRVKVISHGKFPRRQFKLPDGITVWFCGLPPRRLVPDKAAVLDGQAAYPKGGAVAVAQGNFRSDMQAGDGLFRAIQHVCGWLNIAEHRRKRTWRFGEARPKATLLVGKYNFLFKEGEDANEDGLWYNPDFRGDFWNESTFSSKKLTDSVPYVRRVLAELRHSPFESRITPAVQMLHEGWQSHDANQRILRTWTAFEILFSRSLENTDGYDRIVDRAAFFAKDRDYVKKGFSVARNYRNRFVHRNQPAGAAESIAAFLDEYFIGVVEILLSMRIRFESHSRLLDTLDLCPNSRVLKDQIVDRRRALKIRG